MGRSRKKRKIRDSRDEKAAKRTSSKSFMDLFVPVPKKTASLPVKLVTSELLDRLSSSGMTTVALTHVVFGIPRPDDDLAIKAIGEKHWSSQKHPGLELVRRLHAVVESLSDVGFYSVKTDEVSMALLNSYDLVSISPRNDATFQAACSSATAVDIITLDYTAGRGNVQLPFKIRAADIKAATERDVVFELPYSSAILNRHQRKALVQACRELHTASLGLKARILVSSGSRTSGDSDVGVMALRMPLDVVNLLQTVLGFDSKSARSAVGEIGGFVLERARQRRHGRSIIVSVSREVPKSLMLGDASSNAEPSKTTEQTKTSIEEDDAIDDGFITFS